MSNHYDAAYKELFSHPAFVQQLMEGFAPPALSKQLDYDTLTKHAGSYITPLFNEKIEDVVWSVKLLPTDNSAPMTVYLYILLEFQSRQDRTMPLRMLHYVASFYHQLIKQKSLRLGRDKLPPVLPLVLYNGDARWRVPTNMRQLIQPTADILTRFQPQLSYYLVDEKRLSDEVLAHQPSPLSSIFAIEKADNPEAFKRAVEQLIDAAKQQPDWDKMERMLTHWVLHHLRNRRHAINVEDIHQLEKVPTMNWLNREIEHSLEQGIEQGVTQGRMDTAQQLLQLGLLSDEQIAQVTKLPLEQVQLLKQQLEH